MVTFAPVSAEAFSAQEPRREPFCASIAVVIPAWDPEPVLAEMVRDLVDRGCQTVVVVDDGSSADRQPIFAECAQLPGVTVLRHAVNLGKGRALKTAFNFVLAEHGECTGVVTADADGQHTVTDIDRVARTLSASGGRAVLGARTLRRDVPLRSRFGNGLTRYVFRFLTGRSVSDTQTGLRGLPASALPALLALPGERYEYEMTMLAHLCRSGSPPLEIPIETVYLDGNRSSHFDPIRDSMRIYFVLLRFYASSLIAAGIDFIIFSAVFWMTRSILVSFLAGRLSSLANFLLNRRFVFISGTSWAGSLSRYYLLVLAIAAASYSSIRFIYVDLHWNVLVTKILVETALSLVSFSVQRIFVFPQRER